MCEPYWEYSYPEGWQLVEPITMQYIAGLVQVGTRELGIWVRNATAHYAYGPRTKRFRSTEEAKAYVLSTYLLTRVEE